MMSDNSNQLPVPYEESNGRPLPPPSGRFLEEVRVLTRLEMNRGRNALISIYIFLIVVALAVPVQDLATADWSLLPVHVTRLLVSLVLIACLLRALPKVQHFAAIILGAMAAVCVILFVWGLATSDVPLIVSSAISVAGYLVICLVLATSSSIRGYLGYCRAKKRHKREAKERKDLQQIVSYQTEKIHAQRQ